MHQNKLLRESMAYASEYNQWRVQQQKLGSVLEVKSNVNQISFPDNVDGKLYLEEFG